MTFEREQEPRQQMGPEQRRPPEEPPITRNRLDARQTSQILSDRDTRRVVERQLLELRRTEDLQEQIAEKARSIYKLEDKRRRELSPPRISTVSGGVERVDQAKVSLGLSAKAYRDNLAEELESLAQRKYLLDAHHRRWRSERKKALVERMKEEYDKDPVGGSARVRVTPAGEVVVE